MPDRAKQQYMSLGSNPEFQRLSYEAQVEVRSTLLDQWLSRDPQFQQLQPQAQQEAYMQLVTAPPAFEDMEFGQKVVSITEAARQGDEEAQGLVDAELFASRMRRASLIFSLVDNHLVGDALHEERQKLETGEYLPDMRERSADVQKAEQYMRMAREEVTAWSKNAEIMETVAGTATGIAEFMALWKVGAGPIRNPAGIGKLFTHGFQQAASRAAVGSFKRFGLSVASSVAHAHATTAIGFAREKAIELSNGDWPQYANFREMMAENVHTFGKYIAFDILTNMLFDIALPHARGIAGAFKGSSDALDAQIKNFTQADWKNLGGFLYGDTMNPALISQYPETIQEMIRQKRNVLNTIRHVDRASKDQLLTLFADTMDLVVDHTPAGAIRVKQGATGKSLGTFRNTEQLEQFLSKKAMAAPDFTVSKADQAVHGATRGHVGVREEVQKTLTGVNLEDSNVLANMIAPKSGVFDPAQVRNFTREALRQSGAAPDVLGKVRVVPRAKDMVVRIPGQEELIIPRMVKSGTEELASVRGLLARIAESGGDAAPAGGASTARLTDLASGGYEQALAEQYLYTPAWVEYAARTQLGGNVRNLADGSVEFLARGRKTPLRFADAQEFGQYVIRQSMDQDYLAAYLKQHEGMTLKSLDDGTYAIMRGTREFDRGTVQELVGKHPQLLNHAPASLGPELTLVDFQRQRVRATYVDRVAYGNFEYMMGHLDRFAKPSGSKFRVGSADGENLTFTSKGGRKTFEVEIPQVGYRQHFDTMAEARQWMNDGWMEYSKLKHIASEKGYRLEASGTKYALYNESGPESRMLFDTPEQVAETLKKAPMPEWAPELSGLGEETVEATFGESTERAMRPQNFVDAQRQRPEQVSKTLANFRNFERQLSHYYRPPEGWLDAMVRDGGDARLRDLYLEGEDIMRLLRGIEYRSSKLAKAAVTDRRTGKIVSEAKMEQLHEYLTAPADQKQAIASKWQLDAEDMDIAQRVRSFFGENQEQGHAAVFGIDADMFLQDYLPRIRANLDKMPRAEWEALLKDGDIGSFWEHVLGAQPPKQLDAFFKHQRVSDVVNMTQEKNLLNLMLRYQSVGHRQMYLQDWITKHIALEASLEGVDVNSVTQDMVNKLRAYRADITGMHVGTTVEDIDRAYKRFMHAKGMGPADARDLGNAFMEWGYMSAMGFRPWLPIRNTFQVFTTLDPWLGGDYVPRAIRDVVGDSDGVLYARLRGLGVMQSDLPFTASDIMHADARGAHKWLKRGLKWYKNSDDYTRAVAYHGTELKFNEAYRQLQDGVINRETFVNTSSGIHAAREGRQAHILRLLDEGQVDSARHLLATDLTEQTMFGYRATMRPELFRKGVMGKMFGMFGTYPVQFVENVRHAMGSNMTAGQKAAWATRFVANGTALAVGFNEIMGINARNFYPWVPMQFAGGPYYNMLTSIPSAMAPGYTGRQARAELLGIKSRDGKVHWDPLSSDVSRWMMPFGFLMRNMHGATQALNRGQGYEAFLTATGAPLNPSWFG